MLHQYTRLLCQIGESLPSFPQTLSSSLSASQGGGAFFLSAPGLALSWLVVINLVTFAVYGIDKRRARQGAWRVRERTLFLLPLLGGSVGAIAGMFFFHHKTKHWYFRFGLPLILALQVGLALWLYFK